MTEHVSEELPRLLTGEASRTEAEAASAHLRTCSECREDLIDALLAHASLASAHRFAAELVEGHDEPLPDLSALFTQARAEGASSAHRWHPRRLLVVAAAVVALAGAGTGIGLAVSGSSGPAGRQIALTAFDVGTRDATATMTGDHLHIDARVLPALDASHRYEVWLTNAQRTRMQPVGWVTTNGTADVRMPDSLVQAYADIEVSVQQVNANTYDYSGTSVLRGSYS
jgi:hypothetical protein